MTQSPKYEILWKNGTLAQIIEKIQEVYSKCTACPRNCSVNRLEGEKGHCNTVILPVVSSVSPHFGEEPPLVGYRGSGTIFLTGCNLNCIFCQNYDISQLHKGHIVSYEQLAGYMLSLQDKGCHNINFVTPTHQIYAILKSLEIAVEKGLKIPLVYNSGGYDSADILQIIGGIFDIYMPDFKYWNADSGNEFSSVGDYPAIAQMAIREMYCQVGDLVIDSTGIASKGLIVRHLILPGYKDESKKIIDFIVSISSGIYLNLMDQYRPEYRAYEEQKIGRTISREEYYELTDYALKKGARITE